MVIVEDYFIIKNKLIFLLSSYKKYQKIYLQLYFENKKNNYLYHIIILSIWIYEKEFILSNINWVNCIKFYTIFIYNFSNIQLIKKIAIIILFYSY